MDSIHYQHLKHYLETAQTPENFSPIQKTKLISKSNYYIVVNNQLYKRDRRNKKNLLRVIQQHEVEPILYLMHNHPIGAHLGTDKMFDKIRNNYYWPQMFEHIKHYVQSCDDCQKRGKYRTPGPLKPIPVEAPFHRIGIDYVGPLPETTKKNKFIIVATDYLTKWPEAKAVPAANAQRSSQFYL